MGIGSCDVAESKFEVAAAKLNEVGGVVGFLRDLVDNGFAVCNELVEKTLCCISQLAAK